MAVIEILGGSGLYNAFRDLGINATRTYKSNSESNYEVWELSKDDLKKLESTFEWEDRWGYTKGSNMGTPFDFFTVNGKELIAWEGAHREDLRDNWSDESNDEKAAYNYSFKEYEESQCPHIYDNLTTYMCDELGVSLPHNVCALAVDLARANGMTLAQLFKIYEG